TAHNRSRWRRTSSPNASGSPATWARSRSASVGCSARPVMAKNVSVAVRPGGDAVADPTVRLARPPARGPPAPVYSDDPAESDDAGDSADSADEVRTSTSLTVIW